MTEQTATASLNLRDLAQGLSEELGVPAYKAEEALANAVDKIADALLAGQDVVLRKALRLYVEEKPARTGRNPRTGEAIQVPARKKVRVAVRGKLKDSLNG